MTKRIICDIFLFSSLFWAPWYATTFLAILFMMLFPFFLEGMIAMLFIDSLYSISTNKLYAHFGIFTISSFLLLLLIEKIKTKIRFI